MSTNENDKELLSKALKQAMSEVAGEITIKTADDVIKGLDLIAKKLEAKTVN